MDALSGSVAGLASATDRQVFGAQVVSTTLDYMNQHQNHGSGSGHNADYDFQKSVLGAWASGAIVNNLV
ncbi:MAG TPA: hypothetical protein DD766_02820 [Desulfovibrio sp.]|jgi:hypothetical protein|nr:hypothetical protein [Desulfovibrio sp.]